MPCYETALAAYQAENWAQAFALLQRGAAAGETDCYNLLAICHEHGQGTAQNCRQAAARDIHTSEDAQARAAEWLQRFQAAQTVGKDCAAPALLQMQAA